MAIYYIEDKNGTNYSIDGNRAFIKLRGKEAYRFLQSPQGKRKRFMKVNDKEDGGENIYIEIRECDVKSFRTYERRNQYISDTEIQSGYSAISMSVNTDIPDSDDSLSAEEIIADESVNVEESVLHNIELQTLRKALSSLSKDEIEIINTLYLSPMPLSEREYAAKIGMPRMTLHDKKVAVLNKLKKFF